MGQKVGYRRDGSRVMRPDAASNANPTKVLIRHGGGSRALRYADLDLRSTAGKEYAAFKAVLIAHLGGEENVTAPQRTLADHAARLNLLTRLSWDELTRSGAFKNGEASPALDTFRRISADLREVLRTLGIERRSREVIPDLAAYLRSKQRPMFRLRNRTVDSFGGSKE